VSSLVYFIKVVLVLLPRLILSQEARQQPEHEARRSEWGRHALTAYTWLRTNRGPQRSWLQKIHKTDTANCPRYPHPVEDGFHITPCYRNARENLGGRQQMGRPRQTDMGRGGRWRRLGHDGRIFQLPTQPASFTHTLGPFISLSLLFPYVSL